MSKCVIIVKFYILLNTFNDNQIKKYDKLSGKKVLFRYSAMKSTSTLFMEEHAVAQLASSHARIKIVLCQ